MRKSGKKKEFVGDSRKTFENITKRNKKFAESYLIDLLTGNSVEKRRRKNFGEGAGGRNQIDKPSDPPLPTCRIFLNVIGELPLKFLASRVSNLFEKHSFTRCVDSCILNV
ncbi:hypothetical protein ILT06_02095 [Bacillus sp. 17RED48]|uniref:hypothetical protein n=1 Tax=Bacillus TaxID=1386 RepID=UPI001C9A4740|nr:MULTISPECIES: hypothetical protein [Bacillus]MBY7109709.1 hypothetical protein [Bacillus sp. 17RED48]MED3615340.1 hypothetical protein [Bacillus wiedmannii]